MSFVSFFSGSVNGLNAGAPVKFRGVPIGSVTEMRFRLAKGTSTTPEELRIPVWFEIDLPRRDPVPPRGHLHRHGEADERSAPSAS